VNILVLLGETPLHSASIKGELPTVTALLEQGADVNTTDHAGVFPLPLACVIITLSVCNHYLLVVLSLPFVCNHYPLFLFCVFIVLSLPI